MFVPRWSSKPGRVIEFPDVYDAANFCGVHFDPQTHYKPSVMEGITKCLRNDFDTLRFVRHLDFVHLCNGFCCDSACPSPTVAEWIGLSDWQL